MQFSKMSFVLGISAFYHDSAACILDKKKQNLELRKDYKKEFELD